MMIVQTTYRLREPMAKRVMLIITLASQSVWQVSLAHLSLVTLKGSKLARAGTRKPVKMMLSIQKVMMMARCYIRTILAINNTPKPATSAATAAALGINMVRMVS